jgi:intracellular septation protein A
MSNQQTSKQTAFPPRMIRQKLLLTLIYAAVIPYIIYRVGTEHFHLSSVDALLLAAISPACGSLFEYVRKRQLSILGLFALVGIVAKVLSALLFQNARLVLISDSLLSGVYGLLLLGSVLIGKPVVLVFVTNMFEKKTPEQRAQIEQRLQAPGVRRHVMLLTAVWGVGLLLLLAISVLLTYTFPIALVVLIRPLIDYGMIATLVVVTIVYGYIVRIRTRRQNPRQEQQPT